MQWSFLQGQKKRQAKPKSKREAKSYFKKLYESRGEPTDYQPVIISYMRGRPETIYGSVALMKQIPQRFGRGANDVDIYSLNARTFAHKMESFLDGLTEKDKLTVEKLPVSGEDKNVFRIVRKRDGDVLIDVSIPDEAEMPPRVVIDRVKYEALRSIYESKKEDVQNPEKKYRREKDLKDLRRIERALRANPNLKKGNWRKLK